MKTERTRKLRLGRLADLAGVVVLLVGFAVSSAEAKQPVNASQLLGTWVTTKADGGLAEIIITGVNGVYEVHPYGSCSPTFCDWGAHPALLFSSGIGSSVAIGFDVTINFSFKTAYVHGHLVAGPLGQTLLEITTQSAFISPRDRRTDYELTGEFKLK